MFFSYSIFRVIDDYYADGEAAYDMRKPLSRDKERKTIRKNGKNVHVEVSWGRFHAKVMRVQ